MGIVWGAITLGAMLLGVPWLAGWLALVAALAAASATRTWGTSEIAQRFSHNRRARVQPPAAVAAVLAAAVTLSSLAGDWPVVIAAGAAAVALAIGTVFGPLGQPNLLRRLVIVLGPAAGAAGLIAARADGLAEGLVLAGMVTVFDSSAYLIGTGASNVWEGVVAGVASIAALTLFVAAVLVPPFSGPTPWLLGGAAALLAPIGPVLARWAVGDKASPVPALKRLDSLMLVGPVWAAGVGLLLHR